MVITKMVQLFNQTQKTLSKALSATNSVAFSDQALCTLQIKLCVHFQIKLCVLFQIKLCVLF